MTMYARVQSGTSISISVTQKKQTPFWLDSKSSKVLPLWVAQTAGFQRLWAQGKVQVSTTSNFASTVSSIPASELSTGTGASSWSELANRPAELVAGAAQPNGFASLDGGGKIPVAQLPSSTMEYQGTYNANTNTPSLADGSGNTGDVYRVSVAGTRNFGSGNVTLIVGDYVIYNGSIWQKSATTDAVASVAELTGIVTASSLKTALSLSNVDNTSDANKPISTATQTALNGKLSRTVQTITGSTNLGSTGDYIILINTGGVPTLPTAVGNTSLYLIKNITTDTVSVLTTSSQTIDGGSGLSLMPQESYMLISDGSNWRVL